MHRLQMGIDSMGSNIDRAKPDWPPVVVAGAYQTAVVLMRDLARRGVRVCCFDWLRDPPGFRTVYGPAFECPNPDDDPGAWLAFMVDLARKLGRRPVLIASADQYVTALAQHAGELERSFRFCQSAITVQALLATKRRQYDIANAHGLPVPRTRVVNSVEELVAFGATAHFPCILKPFHFREWQRLPSKHPLYHAKLVLADSPEELLTKYRMASGISAPSWLCRRSSKVLTRRNWCIYHVTHATAGGSETVCFASCGRRRSTMVPPVSSSRYPIQRPTARVIDSSAA
jgi:predicted ATP-grasp superfamily ATP-dependent carboligase